MERAHINVQVTKINRIIVAAYPRGWAVDLPEKIQATREKFPAE